MAGIIPAQVQQLPGQSKQFSTQPNSGETVLMAMASLMGGMAEKKKAEQQTMRSMLPSLINAGILGMPGSPTAIPGGKPIQAGSLSLVPTTKPINYAAELARQRGLLVGQEVAGKPNIASMVKAASTKLVSDLAIGAISTENYNTAMTTLLDTAASLSTAGRPGGKRALSKAQIKKVKLARQAKYSNEEIAIFLGVDITDIEGVK